MNASTLQVGALRIADGASHRPRPSLSPPTRDVRDTSVPPPSTTDHMGRTVEPEKTAPFGLTHPGTPVYWRSTAPR